MIFKSSLLTADLPAWQVKVYMWKTTAEESIPGHCQSPCSHALNDTLLEFALEKLFVPKCIRQKQLVFQTSTQQFLISHGGMSGHSLISSNLRHQWYIQHWVYRSTVCCTHSVSVSYLITSLNPHDVIMHSCACLIHNFKANSLACLQQCIKRNKQNSSAVNQAERKVTKINLHWK